MIGYDRKKHVLGTKIHAIVAGITSLPINVLLGPATIRTNLSIELPACSDVKRRLIIFLPSATICSSRNFLYPFLPLVFMYEPLFAVMRSVESLT
jgi:hypothetical protein